MILAIDTSTARLGIAVYSGTEVLAESCWTSPNRHTVSLAAAVDAMLNDLEVDKKKLKAVAVALGPGSFTSLRVGLSFAKGISLGLGIPVIGVPTLDVTAAQHVKIVQIPVPFQTLGIGELCHEVLDHFQLGAEGLWVRPDDKMIARCQQDLNDPGAVNPKQSTFAPGGGQEDRGTVLR